MTNGAEKPESRRFSKCQNKIVVFSIMKTAHSNFQGDGNIKEGKAEKKMEKKTRRKSEQIKDRKGRRNKSIDEVLFNVALKEKKREEETNLRRSKFAAGENLHSQSGRPCKHTHIHTHI